MKQQPLLFGVRLTAGLGTSSTLGFESIRVRHFPAKHSLPQLCAPRLGQLFPRK